MLPLYNSHLLAVTGGSIALLVGYYYAVYFGLKVQGKEQTERQNSWVLTVLSRCVARAQPRGPQLALYQHAYLPSP